MVPCYTKMDAVEDHLRYGMKCAELGFGPVFVIPPVPHPRLLTHCQRCVVLAITNAFTVLRCVRKICEERLLTSSCLSFCPHGKKKPQLLVDVF
jgi:hypothetical protein